MNQILFGTGLPGAARSTAKVPITQAVPTLAVVGRSLESAETKFPGVTVVYRSGEKALRKLLNTTHPDSVPRIIEYLQREGTWGHGIAFKMNPKITEISSQANRESHLWSSYLLKMIGLDSTTNKLRRLKDIRMEAVTSHERKNEALLREEISKGNTDLKAVRVAFNTLNKMCKAHLPPDERPDDEKTQYAKRLVVQLGHIASDVLKGHGKPLLVKRDSFEQMHQQFIAAAGEA